MDDHKTHYQVLGVQEGAEDVVIRAAYRALAQKYHPDKWRGDLRVATRLMTKLNAAYEVLSDPAKRGEYDAELRTHGSGQNQKVKTTGGSHTTRQESVRVSNDRPDITLYLSPLIAVAVVVLLTWWNANQDSSVTNASTSFMQQGSDGGLASNVGVGSSDKSSHIEANAKSHFSQDPVPQRLTDGYKVLLADHIRRQVVFDAQDLVGNPTVIYWVSQDHRGKIMTVKLVRSSGVREWDAAVEEAIFASSPFPLATDGSYESQLELRFRPKVD